MRIELERVQYMPKELKPGVLYVSEEFKTSAHLCACGCGRKVRTPLGPTEWQFKDTKGGPTLFPSVGNWQFPCQSHYWLRGGKVIWAEKWTPAQIAAARHAEAARRHAHYDALDRQRGNVLARFWHWLKRLLGW